MKVPLLDLKAQYRTVRADVEKAVAQVFEDQNFIMGKQVQACEEAVAAYSQARYGVGVSSGTDALLLALMAEGVGPGDEVITCPYTFFATAGSIWRLGAKPVFVDMCPETFNLCPNKIEAAITPRTKVLMPVHLFGQMADMQVVMALARKHNLVVIEDAAQAIGATHPLGRAGSVGHYGCFSFFPSKNLGGAGDGGMVVTNDEARAEKMRLLRNHGAKPKYFHKVVGGNFRLDTLQAAVVLAKLPHLDAWVAGRQRNALRYDRLFEAAGLRGRQVRTPKHPLTESSIADGDHSHIFNQYVIRVDRRDALMDYLRRHEVGTEIYYPVPLHRQECFASLGYAEGSLPNSEAAAKETLALPIFPELSDEQAAFVVDTIANFYRQG